ncbi:hypothetical protein L5515_010053 [Caenorhabditis briggsae]|uniref:Secreted protein n=1 Tax=Caenorhabditis briggsae TaxID=6238 RepID=A0AAE9EP85_CAEBR|nr:hypothetical protein L3Y34_002899 [Caenorhabditis briggsae]UMM26283.1 hypothetical protein L5515_010053 [Caenorhabditis briggsae]
MNRAFCVILWILGPDEADDKAKGDEDFHVFWKLLGTSWTTTPISTTIIRTKVQIHCLVSNTGTFLEVSIPTWWLSTVSGQ